MLLLFVMLSSFHAERNCVATITAKRTSKVGEWAGVFTEPLFAGACMHILCVCLFILSLSSERTLWGGRGWVGGLKNCKALFLFLISKRKDLLLSRALMFTRVSCFHLFYFFWVCFLITVFARCPCVRLSPSSTCRVGISGAGRMGVRVWDEVLLLLKGQSGLYWNNVLNIDCDISQILPLDKAAGVKHRNILDPETGPGAGINDKAGSGQKPWRAMPPCGRLQYSLDVPPLYINKLNLQNHFFIYIFLTVLFYDQTCTF